MKVIAPKTILDEGVEIPTSKSISNRLLIIKALSDNGNLINISEAEDSVTLQRLLSEMPNVMDVGHAGTAFRFLTSYLAITPGEYVLTGSDRMKKRPISPLVDALRTIGAQIEYVEQEGFPPLKITGQNLQGGAVEIEASVSSQFITALMLIGPQLKNGLQLTLSGDVVSRPYIDMTAKLMSSCAAQVKIEDNKVEIAHSNYRLNELEVEKDWSAISFWYELVLIGEIPHLLLKNVKEKSIQGDVHAKSLFESFGVKSRFEADGLHLQFIADSKKEIPRIIDFKNTPDLIQPFVVAMAAINETFILSGSKTLKYKETDRALALKTELAKFQAVVDVAPDSILVMKGVGETTGYDVEIATYQDHRMAMSFAPLAMKYGQISIQNPEVVEKSYPSFWKEFEKLGFTFEK